MARSQATTRIKAETLAIVRDVPPGRVATFEAIGAALAVAPRHIAYILAMLTDGEREIAPWHRVVAKGGAIGRGPHRDAQFARLVREGVLISPAGIVQDLARVAISPADAARAVHRKPDAAADAPPSAPASRSRGMKDRPMPDAGKGPGR